MGAPAEFVRTLLTLANGPADIGSECILWPYAHLPRGYGMVKHAGRLRKVSHVVLEGTGRPRPAAPANLALHACDTPACVHPNHLRWGTQVENMAESEARNAAIHRC